MAFYGNPQLLWNRKLRSNGCRIIQLIQNPYTLTITNINIQCTCNYNTKEMHNMMLVQ